ncbi:Hypothetical protein GL50581_1026 [Giardia duodenalis ATCC 50581]|uniref:Uncharacterized protein n=1 Tax=Giardia intestinalis (strain ATCC 50581 / GS clone H7) TaxID=598745 RepID=C6LQJ7_GIAIB|nr:Hypothetical protein GL50581_1026 [Giardia intestinalis ATCC 50581]
MARERHAPEASHIAHHSMPAGHSTASTHLDLSSAGKKPRSHQHLRTPSDTSPSTWSPPHSSWQDRPSRLTKSSPAHSWQTLAFPQALHPTTAQGRHALPLM